MITNLALNIIVLFLGAIFSWLPTITNLPNILGFDIDAALVTGMGQFNQFANTFWPLKLMFQGFLVIMIYFGIKMALRFLLGHRAPGHN